MALVCELTGCKLGEKKEFKEKHQADWEKFASNIISKLGSDWKVVVDVAAFFAHVPEGDSYRPFVFQYLHRSLENLSTEFSALDGDLADAFKDACKGKKLILNLGGTSNDYPAGRYGVKIDDNITITMAKDRWSSEYPYDNSTTVSAFGLKHF